MEENNRIKLNKNKLTDQLDKRHKERQINLDTLQELKDRESSESEAIDYFSSVFDGKIQEITNTLNSLMVGDLNQLTVSFAKVNSSLQELQRYLSSSTLFLTDFKIKTCQNSINELTALTDKKKIQLIPKKKFGFRAKTTAVKESVILPERPKNPEIKEQNFEWTISDKINEVFLLQGDDIDKKDITFSNLKNCIVEVQGHPGSVQMSNLKNCIIICGPVLRSIFSDNCHDCKFAFACQQMRLHTSTNCEIYLHVTCRGIIEDCKEINIAPYNYSYFNLNIDFTKSGLDQEKNNWTDIADFNWLSPDKPSPNWRKMNETDLISDWSVFIEKYKQNI